MVARTPCARRRARVRRLLIRVLLTRSERAAVPRMPWPAPLVAGAAVVAPKPGTVCTIVVVAPGCWGCGWGCGGCGRGWGRGLGLRLRLGLRGRTRARHQAGERDREGRRVRRAVGDGQRGLVRADGRSGEADHDVARRVRREGGAGGGA